MPSTWIPEVEVPDLANKNTGHPAKFERQSKTNFFNKSMSYSYLRYTEWNVCTQSCLTLLLPFGLQPTRLLCPWNFPGKNTKVSSHSLLQNTGVGCHFLLQGLFLTQGSNPCLLHWAGKFFTIAPFEKGEYQKFVYCLSEIQI